MSLEMATVGGGCFWCVEAVLQPIKGVEQVVSGYAGGSVPNPTYEMICTGRTGHAEVVQVSFDPAVISYRELLEVFFATHDPTTLNRQGHDTGTQYRSVVYYHSPEQQQIATALIAELDAAKIWPSKIVTQVAPLPEFYPAEAYHQNYFNLHPEQGYCQAVISPKLFKLRQKYAEWLKAT